jgi:hypothetical protein
MKMRMVKQGRNELIYSLKDYKEFYLYKDKQEDEEQKEEERKAAEEESKKNS